MTPNAEYVRLTDNQRQVIDYLRLRDDSRASTADLEQAKVLRGWTFQPRSVVANLAKRGLVTERYVAFTNTTYWRINLAALYGSSHNGSYAPSQ